MTDADFEDLLARCIELHEAKDFGGLQAVLAGHPAHQERLRAALRRVGPLDQALAGPAETSPQLGDFRLLHPLGGGGMGIVYLAEQVSLGRKVAVKVVRPELLAEPIVRERFQRETEIVARLQHPGIVQVLAVGDHGPIRYLAMEYVAGCSLADVQQAVRGRTPHTLRGDDFARAAGLTRCDDADEPWWRATTAAIAEVAETVAFVHDHGLIHRDLKPSNILVTTTGRTKLVDFGLVHARHAPRLTHGRAEPGSPAYMSPEQVLGQPIDERSDVYSLALTLRELLVLQLPFPVEEEHQLRAAIVDGVSGGGWWRRTACPGDLAIVLDQAMDPDRSRRHRSMADFAADLRAVLAARPIGARHRPWLLRLARWRRRQPFAAGVLAVAATLAAVAPMPMWWWQRQHGLELEEAQRMAESDFAEAEAAIQRMLEHASALDLAKVPAATPIRLQLMQEAVGCYERLHRQHRDAGRLASSLAVACWRYGIELRMVGAHDGAVQMLTRAEELFAGKFGADEVGAQVQRLVARKQLAIVLRETGDQAGSARILDDAARLATAALSRWPTNPELRLQLADQANERSQLARAAGDEISRLALLRGAIDDKRAVRANHPEVPLVALSLAMQCLQLAEALPPGPTTLAERQRLASEAATLVDAAVVDGFDYFREGLRGDTWLALGRLAREAGQAAEARALLERTVHNQKELLALAPVDGHRLRTLCATHQELARVHFVVGDQAAAHASLADAEAVLDTLRSKLGADPLTGMVTAAQRALARELATVDASARR